MADDQMSSAVQVLSEQYDYDPYRYDPGQAARHHRALIQAMKKREGIFGGNNQRLLPHEVEEARRMYAAGEITPEELAAAYDADIRNIRKMLSGITYGNVPGPIDLSLASAQKKFSEDEIRQIREAYAYGLLRQYEIAEKMNVGLTAISNIVNGLTYRDYDGPIVRRGKKVR